MYTEGACVLQVVRPIAGGMKRHIHSLAKDDAGLINDIRKKLGIPRESLLVGTLEDKNLRRNLGAAAREHVKYNFREETMIREVLNVYDRLLKSKILVARKETSCPRPLDS